MDYTREPGMSHHRARMAGMTLVEVMIASLVLAVMVLGSAAYMYQSRAGVYNEANRRVALTLAASRLEHVRASAYADVRPDDTARWFLARNGDSWQLTTSNPRETVAINGRDYQIRTFVRRRDRTNPDAEFLYIIVRVWYATSNDEYVELTTNVAQ